MDLVRERLLCECGAKQIDVFHAYLVRSEELVAKALSISEVARIARGEQRIREYMLAKWRVRSKEAAVSAQAVILSGGPRAKAVSRVDAIMDRWSGDVRETYVETLARAYRLARVAGHKKATGRTTASLQYVIPEEKVAKAAKKAPDAALEMSFDIQDKRAIAALQRQEMMWIGDHYGENVAAAIKEGVGEAMLEGLGREAAGRLVRDVVEEKLRGVYAPGGWRGTDEDYFEGLAANATTNARVQGQLESFARVKVTTYEIVNPMDSRTTPFCEDMNGTFFSVQDGVNQLSSLRAAKTPDEVRAVHPWMSGKQMGSIRSKGGAKALAANGLALPPYHFRCRSTVDVASESSSYADLAADD